MKRIVMLAAAVAATAALSMTAAQADGPVGGVEGPVTGCGLHLDDHGTGPGFYDAQDDGSYRDCGAEDAAAEAGL